jgi:hypothetical protein
MQAADIHHIIEQIHAAPHQLVFEFAGAGSLALWWLHSVGGSSRTVLEATDRYAAASLRDMLGAAPRQTVSVPTAFAMAEAAYRRAVSLKQDDTAPDQQPVLGVVCTAAIATDYSKRGDHHGVVAVRHAAGSTAQVLTLTKGLRDRLGEETLVSRMIIRSIVQHCGLQVPVPLDLSESETISEHQPSIAAMLTLLADQIVLSIHIPPDGSFVIDQPPGEVALLSGAFNPLHEGHIRMAQKAEVLLGMPVLYELPVVNADKGTLPASEVEQRLEQFRGRFGIVLSAEPLFVEKARLFPGCVFVVGYDTAVRMVNPRYYGGEAGMHTALSAIRGTGCRFLVAGRVQQGRFHTLYDIALPPGFDDLFLSLPEEEFRVDISSTELREQGRHK